MRWPRAFALSSPCRCGVPPAPDKSTGTQGCLPRRPLGTGGTGTRSALDERLGFLGPAVTSLALIDILGLHLRSPGLPAVPLGFSNVPLLFVRNHPPRASCHRTRLPHHLALTGRVLAWFPRFPALASTVGLAARRPRPAERGSLDSRMPRPVLSALRARRSPRLPRKAWPLLLSRLLSSGRPRQTDGVTLHSPRRRCL